MAGRVAFVVVALAASWLALGPAARQASRLGAPAPEVGGEHWINSAPLTTPGLRGRVVVVEIWALG